MTMLQRNRKNLISKNIEPLTPERAYHYCLRLLTGRDYTVAALGRKLASRGLSGDDCADVIVRLQREGWVDDARFAERFASSAISSGRFYGVRLRMEMRRKGFPAEMTSAVLAPLLEDCDEVAEVLLAAERRAPGFCYSTADDRERRRLVSYLQRRGFTLSAILQALRR